MECPGQREESLAVPGEDKAESSSWVLGEGQRSPGHAEETGGAEAGPQQGSGRLTVCG